MIRVVPRTTIRRQRAITLALADAIRSVATVASQDPTAVLDELARQAEALFGCDGASIHLAEMRDGALIFRRVRVSTLGRERGVPDGSTWRAEPPILAALLRGEVTFHERFQADISDDARALPWLREIASGLYAPLIAADEPLGVLFAAWRTRRAPDPDLLMLADALRRRGRPRCPLVSRGTAYPRGTRADG